jgi:hypothetical protein
MMTDEELRERILAAQRREAERFEVLAAALDELDEVERTMADAVTRDTKKQHTRARDAAVKIRELLAFRYAPEFIERKFRERKERIDA